MNRDDYCLSWQGQYVQQDYLLQIYQISNSDTSPGRDLAPKHQTISDTCLRKQYLELFDLQFFGFTRNLQMVVEVVPGCERQLPLRIGAISLRSLTPEGLMNILDLHESQRYALCLEPLSPSPFHGHITFSQVVIAFPRL